MSSVALTCQNTDLDTAPRPARRFALLSGMVTMGAAEIVNRATRIGTALALAWALSPLEFGLAAIAMTASDIMRALTQTGIGARIISVEANQLEETCTTAHHINWWVYVAVALVQAIAAWPVAMHFGDARIAWLMWAFAVPYLLYPVVAVQVYRVQRQHRMRETAIMLTVLLSGDNILTAAFAVAGLGLWSLAIPKTICAIAWVVAYRRIEPWTPTSTQAEKGPLLRYGAAVMASELTSALRLHADKLIIGQVLGLAVLGQYFFAFNAGLGITSALASAAATSLLPHFSGRHSGTALRTRFFKGTAMLLGLVVPVVAAQTLLAPWYVPLVFGAQWVGVVPLLMALCWLAVPLLVARATSLLLRARGYAALELKLSIAQAGASLLALAAALPFGLMASISAQIAAFSAAAVISMVMALRICCSKASVS